METVQIFCCGGTIDKLYFDAKSDYRVGAPAAVDILIRARAGDMSPRSLCKKDSAQMTDSDRQKIVCAVAACECRRIVITHGTDTMCDSARALQNSFAENGCDKTVVLTGSFLPAICRDSDADFNFGFALAAAMTTAAGVYVAMNGKIIAAHLAVKNFEKQCFQSRQ